MKRIERIPLKDVARLEIYINNHHKPNRQIKRETGADYLVNLVYFTRAWKATCQLKSAGRVYARSSDNYDGLAWNVGPDIRMVSLPKQGGAYHNYFACMAAIKDGKPAPRLYYNADVAGKRGRQAIALTYRDELLLYCSHDGVDGDTPEGVRDELVLLGDVKSAVIGDGGTKATLLGPNGSVEGSVDTVQNLLLVFLKRGESLEPRRPKPMVEVRAYSLKKEGNKKVSAHFRVREFACKDGSDVVFIAKKLPDVLEEIRHLCGDKPMHGTSGYRTVTYNARKDVGGAQGSQHTYGCAFDFWVEGVDCRTAGKMARVAMPNYGGVGVYPKDNVVHVDIGARKADWVG